MRTRASRNAIVAIVLGLSACARARLEPRTPLADVDGANASPTYEYADLRPALERSPELAPFVEDAARRRIQILVARPTDDSDKQLDRAAFRPAAEYFYPASAVKLCVAVAAAEKLDELRRQRADLSLTTPLRISFADARSPIDTTLGEEIERALVVSDNDAFNRLLDLVGVEELGTRLAAMGLATARIAQRLGETGGDRLPPPAFELRGSGPPIAIAQRIGIDGAPVPAVRSTLVGSAHVDDVGRLVEQPFDFAEKNAIALAELQDLLIAIARPELSTIAGPHWASADGDVIRTTLGTLPSELPAHPPRGFDERFKPLHVALKAALPGHDLRVYGKGGRAYGFTVENAYVVDATTRRSVFVAATIYANDNETINDDRYEYASVADPFIGALARFVARTYLE